jgi:hypothetical protein
LRLQSLLRRRPSPAMLISMMALFLSLGGVGYAAVMVPNGSVGTRQLRNGAVTYRKIEPGSVGRVRANTSQLQVRVSGSCDAGKALGAINSVGKVTCNAALPAEQGTTNNTASVPTTATSPTTVTSLNLAAGSTYLAFANPAVKVTSGATAQHVTVTCTLTVGSNTETRSATLDTTGTANQTSLSAIPLQAAGQSGAASVACDSAVAGTGTAPDVAVTAAIDALQTASNG